MTPTTTAPQTWHICISGFTESTGERTGLFRLWVKLGFLRSPSVQVLLLSWRAGWPDVAEQIRLATENGSPPKIYVYAYSWGAGWGFLQLAKQLAERGISIEHVVLCDPVYRPWFFLFRLLALTDVFQINVPPSVKRVTSFFQRQNRPRGHTVVATSSTRMDAPRELQVIHAYMDDQEEFHESCLEIAYQSMGVAV